MLEELTDDNTLMSYPSNGPYIQRDQGVRSADQSLLIAISDIEDILKAAGYGVKAAKAHHLLDEAQKLFDGDAWSSDSEALWDIYQEAEQLEHVSCQWDGDAGTFTTTISDLWIEIEPDKFNRFWPNVTPSELCKECGQPDNCGDCNHVALSIEQVKTMGGIDPDNDIWNY